MLLMTETNLDVFHAQLLTLQDAPAMDQLCAACGTPRRPRYRRAAADQCRSGGLCRNRHVTGRHGHAAHVWPKAVWRSRCAQLALGRTARALCWHRPRFTAQYLPVRRFLAMALGLAKQRCASYHIWAALPLTPTPDGEELCAQYLASGLTLRAVVPLDSQQLLVFAAHTPVSRGSTVRRVHLQDPALPRLLERAGAVADFGWDKQGLVLSVRRME